MRVTDFTFRASFNVVCCLWIPVYHEVAPTSLDMIARKCEEITYIDLLQSFFSTFFLLKT